MFNIFFPFKYSTAISGHSRRQILFFESDLSELDLFSSYRSEITEVFKVFQDLNLTVYIKPHPRLGHSKFLDIFNNQLIPSYIPAEFISYDSFLTVIGISTIVLSHVSRVWDGQVISLLDLFHFKKSNLREYYREMISTNSEANLRFVSDIDLFKSELIKLTQDT